MKNSIFVLLSAAALAMAGRADPATVSLGACAHVSRDEFDGRKRTFRMMRKAGLDCVRTDFDWRFCQPAPDAAFDFSRYDRVVDDAAAQGVAVLPILNAAPGWAMPVHEHLDAWRAFVRAIVGHFRGRIDAWEVWNEPNLPMHYPNNDAAAYAAMLRAAAEEIRAADPGARVCFGGTAWADSAFLDAAYKHGAKDCFDIFAIHPYSAPQPPEFFLEEALGRVRGVMARHGDEGKPVWLTEIGWPTSTEALPEQNLLLAGLRVAQPGRRAWRAGCVGISDDASAAETVAAGLRAILPEGSTARAYTPAGLVAALEAGELDLVVYPVAEAFPLETLEAVRDFVAQGGTLVDFGGAPMWFAYRGGRSAERLPDGRTAHDAAWEALRISLVFPSADNGLSAPTMVHATPEGIAAGLYDDLNGFPCHRFFDAARLKDGDEMVPLLAAPGRDGYTGVGACVYRFGSDYRGSVVLSGNMSVALGGNSEREQADYLLRAVDAAGKLGVERLFVYEFRATEKAADDRESHYGIVHADFKPKPAYRALAERAAGAGAGGG